MKEIETNSDCKVKENVTVCDSSSLGLSVRRERKNKSGILVRNKKK